MKCEATKINNLVGAEKSLSHGEGKKKKNKKALYEIPDSAAQELFANAMQYRWGKVFSIFD